MKLSCKPLLAFLVMLMVLPAFSGELDPWPWRPAPIDGLPSSGIWTAKESYPLQAYKIDMYRIKRTKQILVNIERVDPSTGVVLATGNAVVESYDFDVKMYMKSHWGSTTEQSVRLMAYYKTRAKKSIGLGLSVFGGETGSCSEKNSYIMKYAGKIKWPGRPLILQSAE